MAIITTLKCEVCETQTPISTAPGHRHYWGMSDDWLIVFQGDPQVSEGYHFCSKACLYQWVTPHEPIKLPDVWKDTLVKAVGATFAIPRLQEETEGE